MEGLFATPVVKAVVAMDWNDRSVVVMPRSGDASAVADLYRLHALIERFGGDVGAWLAHLHARGRDSSADARLARSLRVRIGRDPALLDAIRRLVAATPLGDDHLRKNSS